MTLPFELAKNDSRALRERLGVGGLSAVLAYASAVIAEAEAFRDMMVHEAGENSSGTAIEKIRFSWESEP